MKFKKTAALIVSVVMAASMMTGCGKTDKSPLVSQTPSSASPSASAAAVTLNMKGAYESLDSKTVMMTINGKETTWGEFFYLLNYVVTDLQSQGQGITDWSAIYADDKTYKDYVLDSVLNILLQNAAVEYGAAQTNIKLSDTDKAAVKADWDKQVGTAGSEQALLDKLKESFGTKEIFEKLDSESYLTQGCFAEMYGADASKLADKDVADYTAADGYMMAKHILIMTVKTDESGNQTPMTETEKAQAKKKAEDILSQLKSYKGSDFNGYFSELMTKNSEDKGGVASYPNGYLFQSSDMVSEFSKATEALKVGEVSDLVESQFGYHIIYRIPIDYNAVPMAYANSGTYSLRYITAANMFKSVIDTWKNSLNVEYSDKYKGLDFTKMFAAG